MNDIPGGTYTCKIRQWELTAACPQRRKGREKKSTEEIVNRHVNATKLYLHFDCFAEDAVLCSKVVYSIVCRCCNCFCTKTKLILLQTLICSNVRYELVAFTG